MALPPFSQIGDPLKTGLGIGELPLVNNQTGIRTPGFYRIENFVERNDCELEFTEKSLSARKALVSFPGTATVQ